MGERNRSCVRHKQDEQPKTIEGGLVSGPNGRGVYLEALWSYRVAAGLTQRELAGMIGSHQSTICELECRNRRAYPKTVKRLCEALAVEPQDLIRGELGQASK